MLGDLIQHAGFNITAIESEEDIELLHFLDSLSLLEIEEIRSAGRLVDIGSGAGFPALVLALALPGAKITALESARKKCAFIERAAEAIGAANMTVCCVRAEDYGRSRGREVYDVAVSRAVAALPVLAEYSIPLLRCGGSMVAMKGLVSDQEWSHGLAALGILGAEEPRVIQLSPFSGAANRWVYVAKKTHVTPTGYPRRPGIPAKRPLGSSPGGTTPKQGD